MARLHGRTFDRSSHNHRLHACVVLSCLAKTKCWQVEHRCYIARARSPAAHTYRGSTITAAAEPWRRAQFPSDPNGAFALAIHITTGGS